MLRDLENQSCRFAEILEMLNLQVLPTIQLVYEAILSICFMTLMANIT
jgi:hypothetical protein